MKEMKVTIYCDVEENDVEVIKLLEHHAEGIFEEYPEMKNGMVRVEILGDSLNEDKEEVNT